MTNKTHTVYRVMLVNTDLNVSLCHGSPPLFCIHWYAEDIKRYGSHQHTNYFFAMWQKASKFCPSMIGALSSEEGWKAKRTWSARLVLFWYHLVLNVSFQVSMACVQKTSAEWDSLLFLPWNILRENTSFPF